MFIFGLVGCCATVRESKVGLGFVSVSRPSDLDSTMSLFLSSNFLTSVSFLLSSLWSSCWFLPLKLLLWCLALSTEERWDIPDALPNTVETFCSESCIFCDFSPHQITQDLERSMNEVFMKYDGQNPESTAADYLQTQVCCSLRSLLNFHSHPQLLPHLQPPPYTCTLSFPLSLQSSFNFCSLSCVWYFKNRPYLNSTVYMCPNVQMLKNMMVSVWATIIPLCSLHFIYYM